MHTEALTQSVLLLLAAAQIHAGKKPPMAPLHGSDGGDEDDHYVVVLKDKIPMKTMHEIGAKENFKVKVQYDLDCVRGHHVRLNRTQIANVRGDSRVRFIERDSEITHHHLQEQSECDNRQVKPTWGLDRISHVDSSGITGQEYIYKQAGRYKVDAYLLDTGVNISHPDFEGRAKHGATFSSDGSNEDGVGHGTCTGGCLGGKIYGVAKSVNIIAVKVFDTDGKGSLNKFVSGVCYAIRSAKSSKRPSVINMSLTISIHRSLIMAVKKAYDSGIPVFAAAGNSKENACNSSPANSPKAYTVAGSNPWDGLYAFTSFGPCVNIIAPGARLHCPNWKYPSGSYSRQTSGTSLATPYVAGVAADLMSRIKFNGTQAVYDMITKMALKDAIDIRYDRKKPKKSKTPNLLLQNGCADNTGE